MKDTTALFSGYPARLTVTRLAPDLAGFNPKDYSLTMDGANRPVLPVHGRTPSTESLDDFKSLNIEYGAPIKVKWTAPANHSKKDWVGLYMIADNASRDATRVSSHGRWVPTSRNEYDSSTADNGILISDAPVSSGSQDDGEASKVYGEMLFSGDKLFWTHGVFEFRYHHDGKHNVMAMSLPFSISINRFDEDDVSLDSNGLVRSAVEAALLPVVRNCFDQDPEIAPNSVEESFGALVERDGKYAKRVVYAVRMMFGIEFAPAVVLADNNVRNLAWRICNAKQVLVSESSIKKIAETLDVTD
jgi:phosphatidylethanolamine N-methyltransferase